MNEYARLALALAAGGGLGFLFFGGLWYTVRKGLSARQPAWWFLGSLLLRMSVVLGGFYLVGHSDWRRLAVCLLGFIIARSIVVKRVRPAGEFRSRPAREASHAP